MKNKSSFRVISFPLLFAAISFSNFSRSANSELVRPVQILTLIGTGMLIGVALTNAIHLYKNSKKTE